MSDYEKVKWDVEGSILDGFNGNVIDSKFKTQSWAVSDIKAISNAVYNYKKDHNMVPNTKLKFVGKATRNYD